VTCKLNWQISFLEGVNLEARKVLKAAAWPNPGFSEIFAQ